MQAVDEFLHNMKFASAQQQQDYAPFVYGHIANYDPKTHRIRAVLPSVRNEDDVPVLTGWMPLSSMMAGAGWGIQIAPLGGATAENPTKGELVAVMRFDRHLGVGVSASMLWNQVNTPPGAALAPGEILIQAPGGSSINIDKTGNITIAGQQNVSITSNNNAAAILMTSAGVEAKGQWTFDNNVIMKMALQIAGLIQSVTGGTYTGDFQTAGNIIAGVGGSDQVGLKTHTHTSHTSGSQTDPPTPGS